PLHVDDVERRRPAREGDRRAGGWSAGGGLAEAPEELVVVVREFSGRPLEAIAKAKQLARARRSSGRRSDADRSARPHRRAPGERARARRWGPSASVEGSARLRGGSVSYEVPALDRLV